MLTNKYAEGYPGRRYYGGCEHADGAERLALERVRRLFACEWANVQPHSGAQANQVRCAVVPLGREEEPRTECRRAAQPGMLCFAATAYEL